MFTVYILPYSSAKEEEEEKLATCKCAFSIHVVSFKYKCMFIHRALFQGGVGGGEVIQCGTVTRQASCSRPQYLLD